MKTNSITSVVVATLVLGSAVAQAGGRHYRGSSCGYRPPVVVSPPVCYDRSPSYYRPSVVSSGWGYVAPVRPATACNTTVYRSYNNYGGGYVESRQTVCRPVYVPPPCPTYNPRPVYVHPRPSCGTSYGGYRSYGGTGGSISFRF